MRLHGRHRSAIAAREVAQDGGIKRGIALLEARIEIVGGEGVDVAGGGGEGLRLPREGIVLGRHDGRRLQLLLPVAEIAVRATEEQACLLLLVGGKTRIAERVCGSEAVVLIVRLRWCECAIASKGRVEGCVVRRGGGVTAYMVRRLPGRGRPATVLHCVRVGMCWLSTRGSPAPDCRVGEGKTSRALGPEGEVVERA